jgi:hypothetical protein
MPSPYTPVRKCIYCGSLRYWKDPQKEPLAKLGDEHIIPASLQGRHILPEASCRECEKITSKIEDHCAERLFGAARPHLRLYRKRNKRRTKISVPVIADDNDNRASITIPVGDHPGILVSVKFPPASFLSGMPHTEWTGGRVALTNILPDLPRRLDVTSDKKFNLGKNIDMFAFVRLLAKIAHSYCCAELGVDGFKPYLLPIILDENREYAADLIGSDFSSHPTIGHFHDMQLLCSERVVGQKVLLVRVRLFSQYETPTHHLIVGEEC